MKIEFHIHTSYSKESNLDLAELNKLAQRYCLDCLIVCDHNTIGGVLRLQKIAPFKVIIGEEISTKDGEIIGLFLKKEIPKNLTIDQTISEIKKQGGLVCLPHPFDRLRRKRIKNEAIEKIRGQIDIVEVFNARTMFSKDNEKAALFARQNKKIGIVGSDAHTPFEIGRTYFEIDSFRGALDFLNKLTGAKFYMRKTTPLAHFVTLSIKIKNRFQKLVFKRKTLKF